MAEECLLGLLNNTFGLEMIILNNSEIAETTSDNLQNVVSVLNLESIDIYCGNSEVENECNDSYNGAITGVESLRDLLIYYSETISQISETLQNTDSDIVNGVLPG